MARKNHHMVFYRFCAVCESINPVLDGVWSGVRPSASPDWLGGGGRAGREVRGVLPQLYNRYVVALRVVIWQAPSRVGLGLAAQEDSRRSRCGAW